MTRKQELRKTTRELIERRAIQNAKDWNERHPNKPIEPNIPKELHRMIGKLTADELSALFILLTESLWFNEHITERKTNNETM